MIYTGSYARPRADLGEAIMEVMLSTTQYIGIKALPLLPTRQATATFSRFTRESILRRRKTQRAPTAGYSRDQIEAEDDTYTCKENGHESLLGDDERAFFASDFDAEKATSENALHVVLREQEIRIQQLLLNTTTFTGASLYTDVSANPWDNPASDAIGHVKAAAEKVRQNCGMKPNAMILGLATLNNLLLNDDIIGRLAGVLVPTAAEITKFLTGIFNVDQIITGDFIYNSASEGKAFVGVDGWGDDYVLLGVVAKTTNIKEPCLGRTFLWTGDSPQNTVVEEYRVEERRSNVFRVRQNTHEKLFDANFGHLLKVDA